MGNVEEQVDNGPAPQGNPAKIIAVIVVALLLVFVVLYALSDRMAPMSSHGFVSANIVQIAPRVSGEVTKVMVDDDAVVQEGDPLFAIDSRPLELNVRQARAKLVSTVQGVDASAASLVAAQTAVTQARTNLDKVRAELGPKGADNPAILAAQAQLEQAQYDLARPQLPHRIMVL